MNQRHVLTLLKQAAESGCVPELRENILEQLQDSLFGKAEFVIGWSGTSALDEAMEKLFTEVSEHRPSLLPVLFPLFAILCGDREGEAEFFADIDWSLI